jgi:hypothetical protein
MRGLTADERFILNRLAGDAPGYVRDVSDEPMELHEARNMLLKDGRCMRVPIIREDGSQGYVTDISPRGREALRCDALANMTFSLK